ncbi:MAG: MBL fold metallo-hydrolase [Rhodospirillales bacterium]
MTLNRFRAVASTGLLALTMGVGGSSASAFAHGADHSHGQVAEGEKKEAAIATQKLNDHLSLLYGVDGFTGGNVLVSSGADGLLMIDDKLADVSPKLLAALEPLGGADKVKFVINTHWHFDHVGGNAVLGGDAVILAHSNVRKRLSTEQRVDAFNMVLPPAPPQALPVVTYEDGVSVHFNGEEIRLIHYPASHTDTDSVVYFTGSGVLHTGDLFFNGMFPFVDVQNGGDVKSLTANVAKLIERFPAETKVVPGHGALATMADFKTYHRMLVETTAHVAGLIKAGKTLDDIKAAGVPKEWAPLSGAGFLNAAAWNSILYASLTQ